MHKPIYSYHTHIDPCSPPLLSPPTLYNTRRLLVSLTSHIRAKAQSTWRKAGGRESSRPPRVGRVHSEGLCKGFENSSGFLHYYLSLPPRRNGPRGLSLPCGKERERNVRRSLTYIYICLYMLVYIYMVVGVSLPTHGPGHGNHAWVGPMGCCLICTYVKKQNWARLLCQALSSCP